MTKDIKVAGCFIQLNNKILILKRNPSMPQGNTWGLAGGKIEPNESPRDCVVKKVKQETGINIDQEDLHPIGTYELTYPDMDVQFFAFSIKLNHETKVTLDPKGSYDYRWVTIQECYDLPDAMKGLYELLEKIGALKTGKIP